jgi:putative DNA primase/helicase
MSNNPFNNKHNDSLKKHPPITEEALRQGQKFQVGNYFVLHDRGVYHVQKNKDSGETETKRIAGPLFISETSRNIDEERVYVDLKFKQHGVYYDTKVRKGQLSIPNELIKLNDMGAEIPFEHRNLLVMYLREQEKRVTYKEVYSKMGFNLNENGKWEYFHSEVIPKRNMPTVFDEQKSQIALTPKGTLDGWVKIAKKHALGHPPAEFMLAVGFSAPLVGYLSQVINTISTIFVHINTDSTVGKTSASMLAVSSFGYANDKAANSLIKDWGSTSNRVMEDFNRNMGVPIVLDELSMSKEKELSSLFYTIASGKGKGRLNDKIAKQDRATWATTVISNGEISAFLRANKNKGLKVRVKQFNGITWTKSSESAEELRQDIQNNYGHAGVEFVKYMFQKGLPKVESLWRTWAERVKTTLPQTNVTARLATDYAVIMTAATLANEALQLGLNEEDILSFIVEHEEKAAATRDVGTLAYDEIKQVLIQNQVNFRQEGNYSIPLKCWGKIIYHNDYVEFAVLTHVMEQQLNERGFENMTTVLNDWKRAGLLNTEGDRNSRRTRIWSKEEQEQREQTLGKKAPKKLEDTTYNLMIPKEEVEGLLGRRRTTESFQNDPEAEELFEN